MDGPAFIEGVRRRLLPIAPILEHAVNKQLRDIGTTPEELTPKQAEDFIKRLTTALEMFIGKDGANKARLDMMSEFRKAAPEHFKEQSLI